jgi:hypothetical protein
MTSTGTTSSVPRLLACAALLAAGAASPGCAAARAPLVGESPGVLEPDGGAHLQRAGGVRVGDAWDAFGTVMIGPPAIAVSPSGDIDVFVHGDDNALWTCHHDHASGTWRSWQSLGGILMSAPAVAAGPDGRIDVFVRGTDDALWVRTLEKAWGEWQSLSGVLTSGPAAVSAGPGRVDVVVRGTDGAVWHRAHERGKWLEWASLGGQATSAPAVTSWGGARLDVFARGIDNALWHRFRDVVSEGQMDEDLAPSWSEWQRLGGVLWSDPAALSLRPGRIDVAARGTDNALWVMRHDRGAWGEWQSTGGKVFSGVALARAPDEGLLFLGAASDGVLELHHAPGSAMGGRRIEGARLLPAPL